MITVITFCSMNTTNYEFADCTALYSIVQYCTVFSNLLLSSSPLHYVRQNCVFK
jgi:hypothetical protein